MIWLRRNKLDEIRYFTSDNKDFKTIKEAAKHANLNYDKLVINNNSYDLMLKRLNKIDILKNRMT